jgi:hypothetical protein
VASWAVLHGMQRRASRHGGAAVVTTDERWILK